MTSSLFRAACGFGIGLLLSTAGSAQPVGSIPREELQVLASAFRELQSSLVERPDDRAAAMFLPRDAVVVQTTGASAEPNRIYRASPEFYNPRAGSDPVANVPAQARNVPMAVLVDGATMSGGEIVAAALQEHRRASVIGQSTGGRASIQTIRPMQMGAIKFTSAYWTSPHGRKLQGVGVTPDRVVGNPEQPEAEQAAMEMLRASMR